MSLFGRLTFPLTSSVRAVRILVGEVGLRTTLAALGAHAVRSAAGHPWRSLPRPVDRRERASRAQAGPAIVLLDALAGRVGPERARRVVERIVAEGAVLFLSAVVPPIDRSAYAALDDDERRSFLGDVVGRFPNPTIGALEATSGAFRFEVSACAFVDLTRRIGRPELADLFCAGDRLYFERRMESVAFERPTTLAAGGPCCDFRFRWRG